MAKRQKWVKKTCFFVLEGKVLDRSLWNLKCENYRFFAIIWAKFEQNRPVTFWVLNANKVSRPGRPGQFFFLISISWDPIRYKKLKTRWKSDLWFSVNYRNTIFTTFNCNKLKPKKKPFWMFYVSIINIYLFILPLHNSVGSL